MELIYADHSFRELGVIKDYELDLAYGKDENNFEITTDEKLDIGMFWFAKDTEYGGIIDGIKTEADTTIYTGRSWHGIIASHHGYEVGDLYGDPVEVLQDIITRTDLPFTVDIASCSTNPIENTYIDKWQDLYTILRQICTANGLKFKIVYSDGLQVSLQNTFDFTKDAYFDITQYTANMETAKAVPNHWIGRNRVGESVYIKHIYLNADGDIIPYTRTEDTGVMTDADYDYPSTDYGQEIYGIDEITEVVDLENAKEEVYAKPEPFNEDKSEGNIEFYGNTPLNWEDEYYEHYYYIDEIDAEGNPKFKQYERKYSYIRYNAQPGDWWDYHWQNYYKKDGVDEQGNPKYTQLSSADIVINTNQRQLTSTKPPSNWKTGFANYYTKNQDGTFTQVEGITQHKWVTIKDKQPPSTWYTDKGSMNILHKKKKWIAKYQMRPKGKGKWKTQVTITLYDDLRNYTATAYQDKKIKFSDIKTFNKIQGASDDWYYGGSSKGATARIRLYAPTVYKSEWKTINDYCDQTGIKLNKVSWEGNTFGYQVETGKTAPDYIPGAYWEVYSRSRPTGVPDPYGEYYERVDASEMYSSVDTYRKFENHYKPITDKILEEIEKRKQETTKISAKLSTDIAEFDVGDIIGGVQEASSTQVRATITKKIVEADAYKTTVSYEIG